MASSAPALTRVTRDRTQFYFDPAVDPVTRIRSGESLIVETEDAHGGSIRSEQDVYQSLGDVFEKLGGANPVTGPIYVEGARPGDCISVHLDEIVVAPIQGQGYTVLTPGLGGLVSSYTLQPALAPRTTIVKVAEGIAHFPVKGKTVSIPCAPFLGTIGVAPRAEKRLSYFQGVDFLGNVDMPLIGPPNTLVLPVHVEGALLSLGDAHIAQGDGEISGAAIETQADVRLTVTVLPRADAQYAALPQINSDDWIGSIASFGGINTGDAIRAAYVDVINRMVRFHGFTQEEAYSLICQVGRVRIGQVVDPLYSAAVTIERRYLE
jgi:acetamidase/formamidase